MSVLKICNLVKNYTSSSYTTEVLKNISFNIEKGDFLIITGPSGSGKTTLLNCISGLEKITSGSILLNDQDLARISKSKMAEIRQSKISFVFQAYNLLPNLTVYENIEIATVVAATGESTKTKKEEIVNLLKQFNLYEYRHYFPNQISGGMQQRCAIIRSLINDPDIIFADEPTGNLDSKSSEEVMNTFKELHHQFGKTIVMVTHSLDHLKYGTRHIHLIDGEIKKDEVLNNA